MSLQVKPSPFRFQRRGATAISMGSDGETLCHGWGDMTSDRDQVTCPECLDKLPAPNMALVGLTVLVVPLPLGVRGLHVGDGYTVAVTSLLEFAGYYWSLRQAGTLGTLEN